MKKLLIVWLIAISPLLVFAKQSWSIWDLSWYVSTIDNSNIIHIDATNGKSYNLRIIWLDIPKCFFWESISYEKSLLNGYNGKIYAEFYSVDKAGNYLSDIRLGSYTGELLSQKMISEWYGLVYKKGVKWPNNATLIDEEIFAKRNHLWLWKQDNCIAKIKSVKDNIPKNITPEIPKSNTGNLMNSLWDFSEVIKKNSENNVKYLQSQKEKESENKRLSDIRDAQTAEEFRQYQEHIKSFENRPTPSWMDWYRVYINGPKWGCYYINGNGNPTYVDHSYCGR